MACHIALRRTAEVIFFNVNAVDIVWLVNSSKNSLKQTSTFIKSETESDVAALLLLTQEDEQNEFVKHARNLGQACRYPEFQSHSVRFQPCSVFVLQI